MASAASEMGQDAVLITSRKAAPDARHLGEYEVVFGVLEGEPTEAPSFKNELTGSLSVELEPLRREVESLRRAFSSAIRSSTSAHSMPEIAHAESLLAEADVARELREDLLDAIHTRLREEALYDQALGKDAGRGAARARGGNWFTMHDRVLRLLREQMEQMLQVSPTLGKRGSAPSTVAVVGPTGAGKTTTIVKLAIRYGLAARKSPMIISADSYRIGATEQLRLYAATLGVAFQTAETAYALRQMLDENRGKEVIFIDTPGLGPADMEGASDLASLFSQSQDIDVHLALPANMRSSNLRRVVERFAPFGASKAILTKIDEAECLAGSLSQAMLAGLPVSFVTNGQTIPEDLEPGDKETLLNLISFANVAATLSAA